MKQGILRALLHDLLICILVGAAGAAGLFVLLLLVGLLAKGFVFREALVIVRGGMLIFGALELFVSAGVILWNRSTERVRDSSQWKKCFRIFGLLPVLMITSVIVLTVASFVDYYLYF